MKCRYVKQSDPPKNGREHWQCARKATGCNHRHTDIWVPIGNRISPCNCRGWPLASEVLLWAEGIAATFGTRKAAEICRYIRWRAKGSPLTELPPGIPHPNIARPPAPAEGPGTELVAIFKAAGASSDQCGGVCQQWIDQINTWGVEGCRKNRQAIINRIKEAAYKTWVTEQIRIGWSISREPWFRISDPVGCIVDEAIRRAEHKE